MGGTADEGRRESGKLVYRRGAEVRAPVTAPTPADAERARAARRRSRRRKQRVWYAAVLVLALALAGKGAVERELERYSVWAGFLFAVGAVFGALAFRVAWSRMPKAPKVVAAAALGYVALFGPVMCGYLLAVDASANDDLPVIVFRPLVELLSRFG